MPKRNFKAPAVTTAAMAFLLAVACAQSDAGITARVKAKLAADTAVKASQIHVETTKRAVTLSGTVDSAAAREQAIALARGTEGVADVVDNLTTAEPLAAEGRTVGQTIDDAAITMAVKSKLLADAAVRGLKIEVETRDGVVSLSGPVKSQSEKDTAVRIARETSGVKDVQDNLVIQAG
jgi:hyperosmotically inducible periplasmic protein